MADTPRRSNRSSTSRGAEPPTPITEVEARLQAGDMVFHDDDLVVAAGAMVGAAPDEALDEAGMEALEQLEVATGDERAPLAVAPVPSTAMGTSQKQAIKMKELNGEVFSLRGEVNSLRSSVAAALQAAADADAETVRVKKRGGELLSQVASLTATLKNAQGLHEAAMRKEKEKANAFKIERDVAHQAVLQPHTHMQRVAGTVLLCTCGVRWQAREAFRASRSAPRLTRSYCMRASGVQSMRRRRDDRAVRVDADLVWLHGFRRWRRQVGHLPAAHVPH